MAPIYETDDHLQGDSTSYEDYKFDEGKAPSTLTEMVFWYLMVFVVMLLTWLLIFFCLRILSLSNYHLLF